MLKVPRWFKEHEWGEEHRINNLKSRYMCDCGAWLLVEKEHGGHETYTYIHEKHTRHATSSDA